MGETSGRECRLLKEKGLIESEKYGKSQRYRAIVKGVERFKREDGKIIEVPQYS